MKKNLRQLRVAQVFFGLFSFPYKAMGLLDFLCPVQPLWLLRNIQLPAGLMGRAETEQGSRRDISILLCRDPRDLGALWKTLHIFQISAAGILRF